LAVFCFAAFFVERMSCMRRAHGCAISRGENTVLKNTSRVRKNAETSLPDIPARFKDLGLA
jgi:hypothetical protein